MGGACMWCFSLFVPRVGLDLVHRSGHDSPATLLWRRFLPDMVLRAAVGSMENVPDIACMCARRCTARWL